MIVRPAKVCGTLPVGLMDNKPLDFTLLEKELPVEQTIEPDTMFQNYTATPTEQVADMPGLLDLEKEANLKADAKLAALSVSRAVPKKVETSAPNVGGCRGGACSAQPSKTANTPSPTEPISKPTPKSASLLKAPDAPLPDPKDGDTAGLGVVKVVGNDIQEAGNADAPPIRVAQRTTEIVNNFAQRKIVDYLKTGLYKKVLVRFHHGLGDTVLFYASGGMDKLREMFPDIEIAFHTALGQEEIFGNVDNDATHYDIVFEPRMPLSEWDNIGWNKAEKCLHVEFGIPVEFGRSVWKLPTEYGNRLIGFHFHSTCMKNLTVNEDSALKIWQYVQNRGFVALSTHMRHKNNRTTLYRFESSNVIDEPARVSKLFGLIKACAGFAGTASGNFHSALALLPPEKILFLKTDFDVKRITHLPIRQLDVRDANKIDFSIVDRWLEQVVRY